MPGFRYRLAVLGIALLAASTAGAQQDRTEQALARAQALLRQVSAQKQELEVANARMQAEIETLETKLNRAEATLKETSLDLASEQRKADRTGEVLDLTRERLERTEETLREAIERLRNTTRELRETEQARAELESELARTESELADSERKNLALYRINQDLLEQYRDKGPLAALLQREPVTGLKGVDVENTLQEYRFKLEDNLRESNRDAAANEPDTAAADD